MNTQNGPYIYKYPHPSVTTDCVIFGFDGLQLRVLLIERKNDPYKGYWAFPGGFLNEDESAETGALRELEEETGMKSAYIKQFHTFSSPKRDPRERVLTIAFYALVNIVEVTANDDAANAHWFALDEVPSLAFDHDTILNMAITEMRKQMYFEPIGLDLLPNKFSIDELHRLFEAVLGKNIDKGILFEHIKQLDLLIPANESSPNNIEDKMQLFTLGHDKYQELKENGWKLAL